MREGQGAARRRRLRPDATNDFEAAVMDGLSQPQKSLPCRFFYDAHGSELFEEITRLPEYYPTRAETAILAAHARDMTAGVVDGSVLIEFGSGSSRKTEILLAAMPGLRAYIPIDVSSSALDEAAHRLAATFPALDVRPIVGDFSAAIEFPADLAAAPRIGFFPGSTIGNLTPAQAVPLLGNFRALVGAGGRMIIGVDLQKDARTLVKAYNDEAGVTAAFNLNLLVRINREIAPAFDLSTFRHEAIYDPLAGRIEMHLVSLKTQTVVIKGTHVHFAAGERIHTENSYKYSVSGFQALCQEAGWLPQRTWVDEGALFSVHALIAP